MTDIKFTEWTRWKDRNSLMGIKFSGICCMAISKVDSSEQKFKLIPEITYIGMTNSQAGLIGRLKQFDNAIIGKTGHVGADRFFSVIQARCSQYFHFLFYSFFQFGRNAVESARGKR